ncbi:hypothetical protein Cadr_000017649 [Camelus dromedarius]|uniref:Uncharacterized protein n=1 Tax=Camelus dromedarius TaxID=9838 RepID=A0A5N4DFK8_CAMDR|nr:hypothetical protein Cadr_000017649 [Camelus dromedarius]
MAPVDLFNAGRSQTSHFAVKRGLPVLGHLRKKQLLVPLAQGPHTVHRTWSSFSSPLVFPLATIQPGAVPRPWCSGRTQARTPVPPGWPLTTTWPASCCEPRSPTGRRGGPLLGPLHPSWAPRGWARTLPAGAEHTRDPIPGLGPSKAAADTGPRGRGRRAPALPCPLRGRASDLAAPLHLCHLLGIPTCRLGHPGSPPCGHVAPICKGGPGTLSSECQVEGLGFRRARGAPTNCGRHQQVKDSEAAAPPLCSVTWNKISSPQETAPSVHTCTHPRAPVGHASWRGLAPAMGQGACPPQVWHPQVTGTLKGESFVKDAAQDARTSARLSAPLPPRGALSAPGCRPWPQAQLWRDLPRHLGSETPCQPDPGWGGFLSPRPDPALPFLHVPRSHWLAHHLLSTFLPHLGSLLVRRPSRCPHDAQNLIRTVYVDVRLPRCITSTLFWSLPLSSSLFYLHKPSQAPGLLLSPPLPDAPPGRCPHGHLPTTFPGSPATPVADQNLTTSSSGVFTPCPAPGRGPAAWVSSSSVTFSPGPHWPLLPSDPAHSPSCQSPPPPCSRQPRGPMQVRGGGRWSAEGLRGDPGTALTHRLQRGGPVAERARAPPAVPPASPAKFLVKTRHCADGDARVDGSSSLSCNSSAASAPALISSRSFSPASSAVAMSADCSRSFMGGAGGAARACWWRSAPPRVRLLGAGAVSGLGPCPSPSSASASPFLGCVHCSSPPAGFLAFSLSTRSLCSWPHTRLLSRLSAGYGRRCGADDDSGGYPRPGRGGGRARWRPARTRGVPGPPLPDAWSRSRPGRGVSSPASRSRSPLPTKAWPPLWAPRPPPARCRGLAPHPGAAGRRTLRGVSSAPLLGGHGALAPSPLTHRRGPRITSTRPSSSPALHLLPITPLLCLGQQPSPEARASSGGNLWGPVLLAWLPATFLTFTSCIPTPSAQRSQLSSPLPQVQRRRTGLAATFMPIACKTRCGFPLFIFPAGPCPPVAEHTPNSPSLCVWGAGGLRKEDFPTSNNPDPHPRKPRYPPRHLQTTQLAPRAPPVMAARLPSYGFAGSPTILFNNDLRVHGLHLSVDILEDWGKQGPCCVKSPLLEHSICCTPAPLHPFVSCRGITVTSPRSLVAPLCCHFLLTSWLMLLCKWNPAFCFSVGQSGTEEHCCWRVMWRGSMATGALWVRGECWWSVCICRQLPSHRRPPLHPHCSSPLDAVLNPEGPGWGGLEPTSSVPPWTPAPSLALSQSVLGQGLEGYAPKSASGEGQHWGSSLSSPVATHSHIKAKDPLEVLCVLIWEKRQRWRCRTCSPASQWHETAQDHFTPHLDGSQSSLGTGSHHFWVARHLVEDLEPASWSACLLCHSCGRVSRPAGPCAQEGNRLCCPQTSTQCVLHQGQPCGRGSAGRRRDSLPFKSFLIAAAFWPPQTHQKGCRTAVLYNAAFTTSLFPLLPRCPCRSGRLGLPQTLTSEGRPHALCPMVSSTWLGHWPLSPLLQRSHSGPCLFCALPRCMAPSCPSAGGSPSSAQNPAAGPLVALDTPVGHCFGLSTHCPQDRLFLVCGTAYLPKVCPTPATSLSQALGHPVTKARARPTGCVQGCGPVTPSTGPAVSGLVEVETNPVTRHQGRRGTWPCAQPALVPSPRALWGSTGHQLVSEACSLRLLREGGMGRHGETRGAMHGAGRGVQTEGEGGTLTSRDSAGGNRLLRATWPPSWDRHDCGQGRAFPEAPRPESSHVQTSHQLCFRSSNPHPMWEPVWPGWATGASASHLWASRWHFQCYGYRQRDRPTPCDTLCLVPPAAPSTCAGHMSRSLQHCPAAPGQVGRSLQGPRLRVASTLTEGWLQCQQGPEVMGNHNQPLARTRLRWRPHSEPLEGLFRRWLARRADSSMSRWQAWGPTLARSRGRSTDGGPWGGGAQPRALLYRLSCPAPQGLALVWGGGLTRLQTQEGQGLVNRAPHGEHRSGAGAGPPPQRGPRGTRVTCEAVWAGETLTPDVIWTESQTLLRPARPTVGLGSRTRVYLPFRETEGLTSAGTAAPTPFVMLYSSRAPKQGSCANRGPGLAPSSAPPGPPPLGPLAAAHSDKNGVGLTTLKQSLQHWELSWAWGLSHAAHTPLQGPLPPPIIHYCLMGAAWVSPALCHRGQQRAQHARQPGADSAPRGRNTYTPFRKECLGRGSTSVEMPPSPRDGCTVVGGCFIENGGMSPGDGAGSRTASWGEEQRAPPRVPPWGPERLRWDWKAGRRRMRGEVLKAGGRVRISRGCREAQFSQENGLGVGSRAEGRHQRCCPHHRGDGPSHAQGHPPCPGPGPRHRRSGCADAGEGATGGDWEPPQRAMSLFFLDPTDKHTREEPRGPHLLPVGRDDPNVAGRHLAGDTAGHGVEPGRAPPFPSFAALGIGDKRRVTESCPPQKLAQGLDRRALLPGRLSRTQAAETLQSGLGGGQPADTYWAATTGGQARAGQDWTRVTQGPVHILSRFTGTAAATGEESCLHNDQTPARTGTDSMAARVHAVPRESGAPAAAHKQELQLGLFVQFIHVSGQLRLSQREAAGPGGHPPLWEHGTRSQQEEVTEDDPALIPEKTVSRRCAGAVGVAAGLPPPQGQGVHLRGTTVNSVKTSKSGSRRMKNEAETNEAESQQETSGSPQLAFQLGHRRGLLSQLCSDHAPLRTRPQLPGPSLGDPGLSCSFYWAPSAQTHWAGDRAVSQTGVLLELWGRERLDGRVSACLMWPPGQGTHRIQGQQGPGVNPEPANNPRQSPFCSNVGPQRPNPHFVLRAQNRVGYTLSLRFLLQDLLHTYNSAFSAISLLRLLRSLHETHGLIWAEVTSSPHWPRIQECPCASELLLSGEAFDFLLLGGSLMPPLCFLRVPGGRKNQPAGGLCRVDHVPSHHRIPSLKVSPIQMVGTPWPHLTHNPRKQAAERRGADPTPGHPGTSVHCSGTWREGRLCPSAGPSPGHWCTGWDGRGFLGPPAHLPAPSGTPPDLSGPLMGTVTAPEAPSKCLVNDWIKRNPRTEHTAEHFPWPALQVHCSPSLRGRQEGSPSAVTSPSPAKTLRAPGGRRAWTAGPAAPSGTDSSSRALSPAGRKGQVQGQSRPAAATWKPGGPCCPHLPPVTSTRRGRALGASDNFTLTEKEGVSLGGRVSGRKLCSGSQALRQQVRARAPARVARGTAPAPTLGAGDEVTRTRSKNNFVFCLQLTWKLILSAHLPPPQAVPPCPGTEERGKSPTHPGGGGRGDQGLLGPLAPSPWWAPRLKSDLTAGGRAHQQGVVGATGPKSVFSLQHGDTQPVGHGQSGLDDWPKLHGVSGKDDLWQRNGAHTGAGRPHHGQVGEGGWVSRTQSVMGWPPALTAQTRAAGRRECGCTVTRAAEDRDAAGIGTAHSRGADPTLTPHLAASVPFPSSGILCCALLSMLPWPRPPWRLAGLLLASALCAGSVVTVEEVGRLVCDGRLLMPQALVDGVGGAGLRRRGREDDAQHAGRTWPGDQALRLACLPRFVHEHMCEVSDPRTDAFLVVAPVQGSWTSTRHLCPRPPCRAPPPLRPPQPYLVEEPRTAARGDDDPEARGPPDVLPIAAVRLDGLRDGLGSSLFKLDPIARLGGLLKRGPVPLHVLVTTKDDGGRGLLAYLLEPAGGVHADHGSRPQRLALVQTQTHQVGSAVGGCAHQEHLCADTQETGGRVKRPGPSPPQGEGRGPGSPDLSSPGGAPGFWWQCRRVDRNPKPCKQWTHATARLCVSPDGGTEPPLQGFPSNL